MLCNYCKAEVEVKRLDQQKTTKMKELYVNKQIELEEVCKRSHMEIPSLPEMDNITNLINSGEPSLYLIHVNCLSFKKKLKNSELTKAC